MIGFGFIVALIIYVVVALAATILVPRYLFETPRARTVAGVVVLLIFVLIPTWDIVPGKLYFDHLCKTEGGLKIYKTVEGVEGFYYFPGAEVRQEVLKSFGYKFIEAGSEEIGYTRYTVRSGQIERDRIEKPSSSYAIQSNSDNLRLNIKKRQEIVVDLRTKEELGERNIFYSAGNWLQVKVNPLLGGGMYCPDAPWTDMAYRDFYNGVLKPSNVTN